MKIDDILGGKMKHGSTVFDIVEAKYNGVVVWPLNSAITYQVVSGTPYFVFYNQNEQMVYSADKLKADGSLHAKMFGDVRVLENGVVKQTLPSVELHLALPSTSPFTIIDNSVYGNNLGTTETSQQSSLVHVSYETSFPINGGTLYQEANVRTVTSTDYGNWQTISDVPTGSPYGYHVSIGATQYIHSTTADECSAAGGSTQLFFPSGSCYHLQDVDRTRTRTVTENCTYTATGSTVHAEPQANQTETVPWIATIEDTPTITGSATGFTRNGMTVSIANRGTNNNDQTSSAARSVTYTATNGSGANTVTATVTIYQEANAPEMSYQYLLSLDIDVDGKISAEPGVYDVYYVSRRSTTKVYPSGSSVDLGTSDITTSVSVTGTGSATPSVNSVTGTGKFVLSVGQNWDTENEKTITVTISTAGATPASDTVTQEAAEVIVTPTARIYPDVDTDGRVRVRLSMTQGQFPSGNVVISGMVYHYILENQGSGTEETQPISGDITITQNGDAVRLGSAFTWLPGTSGEHWFSATSVSRIGLSNTTFPHESFDIMPI